MSKPKPYPLDGPNQEWHAGYAAGLKAGRRLERRALRRIVRTAIAEQNHEHCDTCWYLGEIVLEKLRAKREGK